MSGPAISTREQKIQWLIEHPDLWQGYGEASGNHTGKKLRIVQAMRDAGLFTERGKTDWRTFSLLPLINEARSRRRHAAVVRVR